MLRLAEYARRMGISRSYAYKLYQNGELEHPAKKMSRRLILVDVPADFRLAQQDPTRVAIYARVSTKKQEASLAHQKLRLLEWCSKNGHKVDKIVEEIGSGLNDNRPKLRKLIQDKSIGLIVVEHQDRLARMNFKLLETALNARGCQIIVIETTQDETDLVQDITDVLTVLCARFYGARGAKARANKLITQAQETSDEP